MPQRYQQEIDAILSQLGDDGSPGNVSTRDVDRRKASTNTARKGLRSRFGEVRWSLSPGKLALTGLALLVGALAMRGVIPGAVSPVVWLAVGLLVCAYVTVLIRPRAPLEKRWRGRLLENAEEPLWHRFRRWWGQKQ